MSPLYSALIYGIKEEMKVHLFLKEYGHLQIKESMAIYTVDSTVSKKSGIQIHLTVLCTHLWQSASVHLVYTPLNTFSAHFTSHPFFYTALQPLLHPWLAHCVLPCTSLHHLQRALSLWCRCGLQGQ